jgi:hypothetical protein
LKTDNLLFPPVLETDTNKQRMTEKSLAWKEVSDHIILRQAKELEWKGQSGEGVKNASSFCREKSHVNFDSFPHAAGSKCEGSQSGQGYAFDPFIDP